MGGGASNISGLKDLQDEYASLVARTVRLDEGFREKLSSALQKEAELGEVQVLQKVVGGVSNSALGTSDSSTFRLQAGKDGEAVSLWHDVPLMVKSQDGTTQNKFHFVCEIPKWTKKKFELATEEKGNPIKQDEKNGVLREFKTGAAGLAFNYGCFPQTWEDPSLVQESTQTRGDNDPLDACEIGSRQIPSGSIRAVKVLGVLCMIDEGETDWKTICIDTSDPWAPLLNDVDDVERLIPGMVSMIREWFRNYKVADGKPQNQFGLNEVCMGREYAMRVLQECHESWLSLLSGESVRTSQRAAKLSRAYRPSMISLSEEEMAKLGTVALQSTAEE